MAATGALPASAPPVNALHRPPSADGLGLGGALSVAVHLGLVAALAVSVSWRRHSVQPVTAELWAAVPQAAAPPAATGATAVTAPTLRPAPPPPPPPPAARPAAPPAPVPAARAEADIAVERARQQREAEARRLAEARQQEERALREQELAEERRERQKRELAQKKEAAAKDAAEKKAAQLKAAEKEAAAKEAERARNEAAQQARADKAQAERVARLREEALQRMQSQLGGPAPGTGAGTGAATGGSPGPGGTGTPGSTGTAARSAGPSAGYEGRIRARILPNIVYTGRLSRSIVAEVEIRLAPDGSIIGKRLTRSSGTPDWDEAVLKAIEKTEILPRDVDGRIPPVMTISLDPGSR